MTKNYSKMTADSKELLKDAFEVGKYVDVSGRKWSRKKNNNLDYRWTTMDFGTKNWDLSDNEWIEEVFTKDQNDR